MKAVVKIPDSVAIANHDYPVEGHQWKMEQYGLMWDKRLVLVSSGQWRIEVYADAIQVYGLAPPAALIAAASMCLDVPTTTEIATTLETMAETGHRSAEGLNPIARVWKLSRVEALREAACIVRGR
jgi:hypothetical protein